MSTILQGTTPALTVTIDTYDFSVSDVTALELTFLHDGTTTIHDIDDVTVDTDENTITYTFTESETLAMTPDKALVYQLRFKFADGSIIGTKKKKLSVIDLISEEMMSE